MPQSVETLFLTPGPQPNGMQATAEGLWILDQSTNLLQLVSYTGELLKTLVTTADRGSGVTDDGTTLWLTSTYSRQILQVDRNTGTTLVSYPSPGAKLTGAHGLEWRAGTLWVANPPSATIYQIDPARGFSVIHTIPAPGNRPHGLAWDGDNLLCVETNHRAVHRLNPQTGEQLGKIELPEPNPEPHGMTLWEGYIYYCDAHTRAVCRL